jgi:hypothetical protein
VNQHKIERTGTKKDVRELGGKPEAAAATMMSATGRAAGNDHDGDLTTRRDEAIHSRE